MKKKKIKLKKIPRKRKLKVKKILLFLLFTLIVILFIYLILNNNITNIYISGNNFYSDQEIIDLSGLSDYPNSITNSSSNIESKLENDIYINKVKVRKTKLLTHVYINVEENYPLYYYQTENKTVLFNGDKINSNLSTINVLNQIPDTIYTKFNNKMQKVNIDILNRISEIKYDPNDVDQERFYLIMNDGNKVYLTIKKFLLINNYIDIVKKFNNAKGIIYLDSGEYFDVIDS